MCAYIIGFSGTGNKVNFDKLVISDGTKDFPVRRLFAKSAVTGNTSYKTFATNWCWYWKNDGDNWDKFSTQV